MCDNEDDDEILDEAEEDAGIQVAGTYFYRSALQASNLMLELFGSKVFDSPKDHEVLARWIRYVTSGRKEALVMDFFVGSASTGHAVLALNREDGGARRYILVQLPEILDPTNDDQKVAANFCASIGRPANIAEIAKERIRRSSAQLKADAGAPAASLDIGFRVLKIDTSNMKDVYYTPDESKQGDLLNQIDNIREDRAPEDLLFQVLVDWGVDLALPITQETVGRTTVHFVDGNALAACFESNINDDLVKEIARRKPLRAVFRDSSYGSDSVKINVEQIFKMLSPSTEIRSI